MFGYDPKMKAAGQTPNGLCMLKTLLAGHVDVLTVDCKSFLAALKVQHGLDQVSAEDLEKHAQNVDMDFLIQLKNQGAQFLYAKWLAQDTLFIPCGWIVVEATIFGSLVYGARRTFFTKSQNAFTSYEELLGCHVAAGKKTDHMMEALEMMRVE